MSKYIRESKFDDEILKIAMSEAAMQLHNEIEEERKIKFEDFRFDIDEEKRTIHQYGEPPKTFTVNRSVSLILEGKRFGQKLDGSFAEKMYKRYFELINKYINSCICKSLL